MISIILSFADRHLGHGVGFIQLLGNEGVLRHSLGFTHDNGFCLVAVNSGALFLQPLSWYVSPSDLLVLQVDDNAFRQVYSVGCLFIILQGPFGKYVAWSFFSVTD